MKKLRPSRSRQLVKHVARRIGERGAKSQNGLKLLFRIKSDDRTTSGVAGRLPREIFGPNATLTMIGYPHFQFTRRNSTGGAHFREWATARSASRQSECRHL